jgi:hypothetical protein
MSAILEKQIRDLGKKVDNLDVSLNEKIERLTLTMSKGFIEVDKKINRLTTTVENLALATAQGFTEMHEKFAVVDKKFEEVDRRFDILEMYTLGNTKRIEIVEDKMLVLNTKMGFK